MIESVTFWPRWRAEIEVFGAQHGVISITCHDQRPARLQGSPEALRMQFYDLVEPVADSPKYGPESLFTPAQAQDVVDFVRRLHDLPEPITMVVHCEAGVSRSSAVALYVAEATGCVFETREKADLANAWVVHLLAECSGLSIQKPPPLKTDGTILLYC